MRVAITGGGTAGHVTPLLAVVAELHNQKPNTEIRYIGQFGDPMKELFNESSINKQYSIFAGKWRRYQGLGFFSHITDVKTMLKNTRDFFYFVIGFIQSVVIFIFWRPAVLFVKGGFVGLPVGLAAALLRIPIITHDSDIVPGLTNRILSKYAKFCAVAMPTNYYNEFYSLQKTVYTGVPLRREFYNINDKKLNAYRSELNIKTDSIIVTIIGGSLGAVRLNNSVISNLDNLFKIPNLILIWVAGSKQHDKINIEISKRKYKDNIRLFSFTDELYKLLAISDIVISRAGATSIAELAELSMVTILVPNPYLVGAHQTKNAIALKQSNAADVIFEDELLKTEPILSDHIQSLINDKKLRRDLSANIHKFAVNNSSNRIVDVILKVGGQQ
jgi:UDP-N-acetylglucosamine--N-acetylmuramyl-(pentapeptide) pyrophosphoryl-undecaprenol N-acetylglucosamine transferase